jgi:hypothetical protein
MAGVRGAPTVHPMLAQTSHLETARESVTELLGRLDRIAASAETLRAMTDHNHGELSPSLPPLLRSLERDLVFASRDIQRLAGALPS